MVVEKDIGGKPIFLRYLPAGSYFGEMAVLSGEKRNATVKAAVGSEVIKLTGEGFKAMLAARQQVREAIEAEVAERAAMNGFIYSRKARYTRAHDQQYNNARFTMNEEMAVVQRQEKD